MTDRFEMMMQYITDEDFSAIVTLHREGKTEELKKVLARYGLTVTDYQRWGME